MVQSKQEIVAMLGRAGMEPRHRFGQNFMIDQNLVRIIADEARIGPGELAIEVGPGTGTLTEELLSRGAEVVAVEIDRDLARVLRERFGGEGRFTLIEGDALGGKHELNAELAKAIAAAKERGQVVKLVANLPYNVASPLIIELLIAGVESLVFTVQKEVAERLRAGPGTKDYGVLTIMAQLLAEVEVLRTLPPQAFWPAPKIESAMVRMRRKDGEKEKGKRKKENGGEGAGEEKVRELGVFVRQLFSARRKTLRKGLVQMGVDAETVLGAAGVDPRARPEELEAEKFVELFEAARGGETG